MPELNEETRAEILDQSLGEYLEGEFGKNFVDDLASAVIHGIYAADIYKLDARKVLPGPVHFQSAMGMSLLKYMLRQRRTCVNRDVTAHLRNFAKAKDSSQMKEYFDLCKSGSIFVLNRGMSTLTAKLAKRLSWADNVDVRLGTDVAFISSRGERNQVTRQLRGQALGYTNMGQQSLTPSSVEDAFKNLNDTVNVMVVNLYYKSRKLAPPGFGYLIPNSTPSDQNPERALGVIFPPPEEAGQDDSAQGTKIGVMMGGHWWDDWKTSDLPTEEQAVGMAKDLLRRHLGIKEEPMVAKARLQRNCIPQTRNSTSSLSMLDAALMQRFSGRLSLAGPSYGPPGLNDCIRAGSVAASNILSGLLSTNLEWYHLAPEFLRYEIKQNELDLRVATMPSAKRS
ncbi:oxygen-dependent protoporphyrinogen oxidase [Ascosphaera pollenicola]|nr:oxygen-dependent protoporphyrinogen oxidase [Ascosphaera pollenicola]